MRIVTHVDRKLVHLLIARTVSVPELRAFVHRKGNDPRRAGVGADDQHVGIAIASGELAMAAIPAEVSITHRRAILHIQFAAHGNRF